MVLLCTGTDSMISPRAFQWHFNMFYILPRIVGLQNQVSPCIFWHEVYLYNKEISISNFPAANVN